MSEWRPIMNAFCPTGEGNGQDNSCPLSGSGGTTGGKAANLKAFGDTVKNPEVSYEDIDAKVNEAFAGLDKAGAQALTKEYGIAGKPSSKKAAMEVVRQRLRDRKGTFERVTRNR